MLNIWLFRFSACGRTTKSAGFWASDSEYEQGPAGEQKTSEFTLSTKVAVEYEYLGREASLKKSPIGKISFDKS